VIRRDNALSKIESRRWCVGHLDGDVVVVVVGRGFQELGCRKQVEGLLSDYIPCPKYDGVVCGEARE
jgi:hypothetical protein